MFVSVLIGYTIHNLGCQKPIVYFSDSKNLYFNWFLVIVMAPIAEEVFWRGYALDQFKKIFNVYTALLLSALLYSLAHVPAYGIYSVQMVASGLILGFWRIRYRALLPLIIAHALKNALFILT